MNGAWTRRMLVLCFVAACLAPPGALAGSPNLDFKLAAGDTIAFAFKRSLLTEGESPRGAYKQVGTSEIQYRLKVVEKKESGDLVLEVTYGPVKVKQQGRSETWEFDSSKPAEGDEASAYLSDILKKTFTVKLSANVVKEIAGFPEGEQPGPGARGDFRRFQAMNVASRRALQRDLELLLPAAVLGQTLEKGKAYRQPREDRPQEGEARRGFWRGFAPRFAYTFEGTEKAGEVEAARFALAADQPGVGEGGFSGSDQSKGNALFSLKDGALLKLEVKTEGQGQGEREGQSLKYARKSAVFVERRPVEKKGVAEGPAAGERLVSGSQAGEPVGAFNVYEVKTGRSLCYV